jgi:hypothetical protein
MKNIHVIPTDKPSRLYSYKSIDLYLHSEIVDANSANLNCKNQNIYITSDEEIKEGDWVYENNLNQETKVYQIIKRDDKLMFFRFRSVPIWLDKNQHGCKKIILTDNQDLIKDGVQAIDDDFLEWFVKNPSCDEVEVQKVTGRYVDYGGNVHSPISYKLIIPKKKPKHPKVLSENGNELFFDEQFNLIKEEPKQECKDCNKSLNDCTCIEDTIDMKEEANYNMKQEIANEMERQETLEEALNNELVFIHNSCRNHDFDLGFKTGGLLGAEWQQERSSKLRDELFNQLPIGKINAFDLLKIINNHIKKLDKL